MEGTAILFTDLMSLGNINLLNLPQYTSGALIHTTRPEPIPHMQLTSLSVKELRLAKNTCSSSQSAAQYGMGP